METVRDFIFLGSEITAGGDCSQDIKRQLLFGRRAMTSYDQDKMLRSREITFPSNILLVKAMVFPVVMYRCESWFIKMHDEELMLFNWCWRRLLRVSWTSRRSNQSILKEIVLNIHWKDWCWNWSFNTLVIWCEELTLWKRPWCW